MVCPNVAAALTVHVLVVADPRDGAAGTQTAEATARLLAASGSYDVVDRTVVEGRLGQAPADVFTRCGTDLSCWRAASAAAGVEQVVLVERVDAVTVGIRVVDAVGPLRMDKGPAHTGGAPDAALLDRLFFDAGGLRLAGAPPGALLRLDGRAQIPLADPTDLVGLPSGKHTIEVEAPGYATLFAAVLVLPDQATELSVALVPIANGPRRLSRWTTWVGVGVLAGGAVGLAAGADARGVAVGGE